MNTERLKKHVFDLNPDIEISGVYKTENSRFDCTCKICGKTWIARAHDLKRRPGCRECQIKKAWARRRTENNSAEKMQKKINEIQPNVFMIGEYKGYHTNVLCRCADCDTEWYANPANLYSGNTGCPTCREKIKIQKLRHDHEDIVSLLANIRPDVTVIGRYTRMHDKLHCYCVEHDCDYYQSPDKIIYGQRGCPYCAQHSLGESKMLRILNNMDVKIETQRIFPGCEYQAPLRFDAYIPQYNIAIEYDGEGHYRPIDFAGRGEEWANSQFERNKIRDSIKDEYCKKNNIELIRIPYWEADNMEEFLVSEIQSRISSFIPRS